MEVKVGKKYLKNLFQVFEIQNTKWLEKVICIYIWNTWNTVELWLQNDQVKHILIFNDIAISRKTSQHTIECFTTEAFTVGLLFLIFQWFLYPRH